MATIGWAYANAHVQDLLQVKRSSTNQKRKRKESLLTNMNVLVVIIFLSGSGIPGGSLICSVHSSMFNRR